MRETVIVEAVRTPVGKRNGGLSGMHAADLSAIVLNELVERAGVDPDVIDDVVWGCVSQVGDQSSNIGRYSVLAAGWPEHIPGTTVNRACGSSQQALDFAVQAVMSGQQDVVVAGGVEVMSRVPLGAARATGMPYGPKVLARYPDFSFNQGISAELIAEKWGFTRTRLDEYSVRSHELAAAAQDDKAFDAQIVPVFPDGSERGGRRRRRPPGQHRREAGRAQAGVRRGRRHPRRQLVTDLRRRGGAAGDGRGQRDRARADPDRALPRGRGHRGRSGADAHRSDPGHREGAAQGGRRPSTRSACTRSTRRSRRSRWRGWPTPVPTRPDSTRSAARSHSATRSARPAPC